MDARIGIGHDTHRLQPGGPLRIGGIDIEHDQSLVGHSDADVLLHAVTDAILGAVGLGDIGELFPDTAAENLGRDSADMLRIAVAKANDAGFRVGNLDCIIFAQAPKMSPYKKTMADCIASIVGVNETKVNVKAKTGEHVGTVGESIVIKTQVIALMLPTA